MVVFYSQCCSRKPSGLQITISASKKSLNRNGWIRLMTIRGVSFDGCDLLYDRSSVPTDPLKIITLYFKEIEYYVQDII